MPVFFSFTGRSICAVKVAPYPRTERPAVPRPFGQNLDSLPLPVPLASPTELLKPSGAVRQLAIVRAGSLRLFNGCVMVAGEDGRSLPPLLPLALRAHLISPR